MKRLKEILTNRMFVGGVLLLIQIVIMVVFISTVSEKWRHIYRFFEFLSIAMIVWLIRKNDNPAYKIPWIIAILIFPLFGGVFYLMWGNTPFNLSRLIKISPISDRFIQCSNDITHNISSSIESHNRNMLYLKHTASMPVWSNTESTFFPLGEDKYQSMLVDLKSAKKFIFLEYFIIEEGEMWNSILDILVQKVQEGVDVRVMYDDTGCIAKLPKKYYEYLRFLGIKAVSFNRFIPTLNTYLNYRDHRKICVIDGNIGYTGGINLADEYINTRVRFGHWKDTAIKITGDATANLTMMFLQLWEFATDTKEVDYAMYMPTVSKNASGYVQPFGDTPLDNINVSEDVYMQIINNAKKYVYITSPYLVLDNEMMSALITAARSGIDVRIITPGIPDKWYVHSVTRSFYSQLIAGGVKIYEYIPGFIHGKMIVADDDVAVVGTINMDFRSFYMHFECGTIFYNGEMPLTVKKDIVETLDRSFEITQEWLKDVPWLTSISASILRIFSPMM